MPILLFALFSLVLLGIGVFVFFAERDSIRRDSEEDLRVIAQIKADAIARWARERRNDAWALTSELALTRDIEQWLSDGAPRDDRAERIRGRMESVAVYATYSNVALADDQGRLVLATNNDVPVLDASLSGLIHQAIRTRQLEISDIHPVPSRPGTSEMHICAPITVGHAHASWAIAVVILTIDPALDFLPLIQQWPGLSPSAETDIVVRSGDYVQYISRPRYFEGSRLDLRLPLSADLPAAQAARGVEGVMEGIDYRGVPVIAALTGIPDTPWHLVAKIDAAEVFAPIRRLAVIVSAVVASLIAATGVLLLAAWSRQQGSLITRRYEEQLKRREMAERFEYLSKYANDIILLTDGSGRITEANDRALDAYGYGREELVGRSIRDLHPPGARLDYATEETQHGPDGGGSSFFESLQRRKDGSLFPVEISARRFEVEGKVWQQIISRDITDRVQAAAAMSRLAAIVESSRDAIIGADLNGNVMTWNAGAERLYGYSAAEMIGRPIAITEPADRKGEIRVLIKKILSAEEVADFETVRVRKDGTPVDVSIVISPVTAGEGAVIGVSAIVRDISERKRSETKLRKLTRTLQALHRGNAVLVRAPDRDTLQREICQVVLDAGDYRLVWIGEAQHDEAKTVRPLAWAGADSEHVAELGITWSDSGRGAGPTGMAIKTGLPQIAQRVADGPADEPWRAAALQHGYQSGVALPLKDQTGVFGALSIHGGEPDLFGPEQVELLTELAEDLSYGIVALQTRADREAVMERLERSMEHIIEAVARTIEMRDPYTAGHQDRVAKIAAAIGTDMGLPADRVQGIHLASIVHDLGKIRVPSEILSKPGRLTPVEYELIKGHVDAGYDILKPIGFPWPIADIVHQHHERLDGSGYPQGLKGDAIILEARIVAVADVVEAMMSHRPFRAALGLDAALAEIERGKGRLFDPAVVESCVKLMRSGAIALGNH
ncbi:MAG TPA: PAS domain S-box protein [Isosphaeraceae bacterium]|nr:PAS domain S-box protein [Isosphaeraceae bacterium]